MPFFLSTLARSLHCVSLVAVLVFSPLSVAEDDDEQASTTKYFELEPAMVTNFGGPGRLRYMKVEITLRVKGAEGESQAAHHLPSIKDSLLNLFAVQTSETLRQSEGKELLRQTALARVNSVLAKEDKESYVEDLLFTSFVAHH